MEHKTRWTESQLQRFVAIADLHPYTVLRFWAGLPLQIKTLHRIERVATQLRAEGLLP